MRPTLQLGISPQLTITPALKQSIRLLQLSALELDLEVQNALALNPLLESLDEEEPPKTDPNIAQQLEYLALADPLPKMNWENQTSYQTSEEKFDPFLHKASELTLTQHLLGQMELAHFSETERSIAILLIDAISEEGYLSLPLIDIQESLEIPTTLDQIEKVLFRIQNFDPLGVGARNLAECLAIQLESLPKTTPWLAQAKQLVQENLEQLASKNYGYLQEKLKLNEETLRGIIKILRSLDPKPGTQLSSKKSEYITPDLLISKKNGQFLVELNKEILPRLRVNKNYATLIHQMDSKDKVPLLKEQLKTARSFIKGLEIRNETLLKVSQAIMEQQSAFLEQGEGAMKPLNLQTIATLVGLHESTVSRITTQKYILTPRGTFELKYFFSNPLPAAAGQQASAMAIRSFIKKIIAEESSQSPLTDHKIKVSLLEKGIDISRRTVAKYREALRIPASTERKHPC